MCVSEGDLCMSKENTRGKGTSWARGIGFPDGVKITYEKSQRTDTRGKDYHPDVETIGLLRGVGHDKCRARWTSPLNRRPSTSSVSGPEPLRPPRLPPPYLLSRGRQGLSVLYPCTSGGNSLPDTPDTGRPVPSTTHPKPRTPLVAVKVYRL